MDMRSGVAGLGLLMIAVAPACAQETEKAEITVANNRAAAVVMRFEYTFHGRSWRLMQHDVDGGDAVEYRYPSNIPGCEKLREWGLTDGLLTIYDDGGSICQERVSLCDKVVAVMQVDPASQCTWRVRHKL